MTIDAKFEPGYPPLDQVRALHHHAGSGGSGSGGGRRSLEGATLPPLLAAAGEAQVC